MLYCFLCYHDNTTGQVGNTLFFSDKRKKKPLFHVEQNAFVVNRIYIKLISWGWEGDKTCLKHDKNHRYPGNSNRKLKFWCVPSSLDYSDPRCINNQQIINFEVPVLLIFTFRNLEESPQLYYQQILLE